MSNQQDNTDFSRTVVILSEEIVQTLRGIILLDKLIYIIEHGGPDRAFKACLFILTHKEEFEKANLPNNVLENIFQTLRWMTADEVDSDEYMMSDNEYCVSTSESDKELMLGDDDGNDD